MIAGSVLENYDEGISFRILIMKLKPESSFNSSEFSSK